MNEITEIKIPAEPAEIINKDVINKTLEERREELRLRLQLNRRVLEHKLLGNSDGNHFPRSVTMRFLSRQSTRHIIQKVAGAALGIQAFKSLRYGYSLLQFARSAYSTLKATRKVVKAKEGV